ncbi:unnamed protein product [Phaedon cochleariae]|uniref:Uncharacterized protein n=1 Tax=Phaedon cochleariae TaxID=80249 RepID=A0A9P0DFT1_PHACE|nr:unnamed protein product [Phaedon cochleariae]
MISWWCILGIIPVLETLYTDGVIRCPNICWCKNSITNCQNNNLTELPAGIDINVTNLDLSINNFGNISHDIRTFTSLRCLNLSTNKIATLGHSDFEGLDNLEKLDLSSNLFHDWKDVHSQAFTKLGKLVYLDLSNNPLRNLPNLFNQFSIQSLEILRVNNCSMALIPKALFKNLENVLELHAAYNPVSILNGTFGSDTLKYMDLSYCLLTHISDDVFVNLKALETLIMRNNIHLRKLEIHSDNLLFLDLSDSSLESVPTGNLKALKSLNLRGNFLRNVPDNIFCNYSSLTYLNLSYNVLETIDENAFKNLDMLSVLDLSINKLATISEKTLLPTIVLSRLDISQNYINSLDGFRSMSLKTLDASKCEIYSVQKFSISSLPKLEHLYLRKNFISSLPDGWDGNHLRSLDLKGCRIRSINNKTFTQMNYLLWLDLSSNRISQIHPSFFPETLITLKLEDNQWVCDCPKLKDMFEWLIFSEEVVDGLICDSPQKVEGENWYSACQKEWNPSKKGQLWWYSMGLIISMTLLLVIVLTLRKLNDIKEKRWREQEERTRNEEREAREARQRMQRLQREFREEASRNAPDPRESQGPPSYTDALLLPKPDPSISGSMHSLASRGSLHGSNPEIHKKNKVRRKRRRRKSESSETKRMSRASIDVDDTDTEQEINPRPLESDF